MSSLNDPLSNVSPETRQRKVFALEGRGSEESGFQGELPSSVMQHVEAQQEQVSGSEAWVHWEYSPEEWALFEKIDWKPASRKFWLVVGLCFLFLLGVVALVTFPVYLVSALDIVFVDIVSAFVSPVLIMALIVYSTRYGGARKRHKARQQNPFHTVTIAVQGVWEAGTYFPFDELNEVKMTPEPPALHFRRERRYSREKKTLRGDWLYVLVPGGHEEEAAQLVQRFNTEVIEARRRAWQRVLNPREPV